MRLTTSNTHVSLTIFAMSILTTRGEHLRSDLQAGSGAVSGRKLLTAREVLTSSLHKPYTDGSDYLLARGAGSQTQRSINILHMHIPKTAGQSFWKDYDASRAQTQFHNLANATQNIDAMKSNLHNFTAENTRKPTNVSHVFANESGMNLTFDDRDGKFAVATDLYRSNQSKMNQTVDDLDEQLDVAADLFEALAEGEGLNNTASIEIAPVYQTLTTHSKDHLQNMKMLSKEACMKHLLNASGTSVEEYRKMKTPGTFLVTLLREPVAHVQSMFFKCKYNFKAHKLGLKEQLSMENISGWVQHYISDPTDNWSCYNPANMQTRAFSCNRDLWHDHTAANFTAKDGWTGMDAKHTFESAKENMDMFDFVGISERFQESLCVFSAVVTSRAPSWCNCSNTETWAAHKVTHHRSGKYPNHKVSDLTETQRELIQTLTSEDDKLYKLATKRFDAQIAKYEAQGILKLSC